MQQNSNKEGQVATLCKCTCITGSRYLPAFTVWKPLSERLTMEEKFQQCVCISFCLSGENWC